MMKTLSSDFEDIVLSICEGVGSPRAVSVAILARHGEWDQLVSLRVDPEHYTDPDCLLGDNMVTDLLRKCEDLPTTFDREAVSRELFIYCEKKCFSSNRRLERLLFPNEHVHSAADARAYRTFDRAREIVASILGPFPYRLLEGRFGPGATYADKGGRSTIPDKMSSEPTLTSSAWTSLSSWASTAWARACAVEERSPKVVRGNRFSSVPKDCTKNRGIAVEPSINVFYQLSLGRLIRDRLRRFGVNLNDGQDTHRRLACVASTEGHLATLDLSNASDTICKNLVEFLLPHSWYSVLCDLRSPFTEFQKGQFWFLEKFSSMGNGFTFELETLIFQSLVLAACELEEVDPFVSCYGDDLIFPSSCSKTVIAFLELSGFEVNRRKSFTSGHFRESCGGDFFKGLTVRGHFLKKLPSTPSELISLSNGIRRSSDRLFRRFYRPWRKVLDCIPVEIRKCRGPSVLGDILIHDEEGRWNCVQKNSIRYFRVWRPCRYRKVAWGRFHPEVVLACAVYGLSSGDPFGISSRSSPRVPWQSLGVSPRDGVLGYKLGWVPYS